MAIRSHECLSYLRYRIPSGSECAVEDSKSFVDHHNLPCFASERTRSMITRVRARNSNDYSAGDSIFRRGILRAASARQLNATILFFSVLGILSSSAKSFFHTLYFSRDCRIIDIERNDFSKLRSSVFE